MNFKLGDRVVWTRIGQPRVVVVVRVMKRFVETSDGRKWNLQGGSYPALPWDACRIIPATPELEARAETQQLYSELWEALRTQKIPLNALRRMAAALKT